MHGKTVITNICKRVTYHTTRIFRKLFRVTYIFLKSLKMSNVEESGPNSHPETYSSPDAEETGSAETSSTVLGKRMRQTTLLCLSSKQRKRPRPATSSALEPDDGEDDDTTDQNDELPELVSHFQ